MYTVKIVGKTFNKEKQRLAIQFAYFLDQAETPEITETKEFVMDIPVEEIKKYAARQIKRLEKVDANSQEIAIGNLDVSGVTPTEPTAADIAKAEWFRDYSRLQQVQNLINLGVATGDEAPIVALREKVRTGFKPGYLADM